MMIVAPKPENDDEVATIMACMETLENYGAHETCECKAYVCPQHCLNRLYHDLRTFALFLSEE